MAATTIKSTYALDVESVRALDELARRWRVSKSEALRRAIRSEASRQPAAGSEALKALDQLQAAARARGIDVARWEREAQAERRAAGRRIVSKPR